MSVLVFRRDTRLRRCRVLRRGKQQQQTYEQANEGMIETIKQVAILLFLWPDLK